MRGNEYPQPDDGAASEVDDCVDGDHFQIQCDVARTLDGTSHNQGGTDGACLPHVEFSAFIPRLDLENVVGTRVASCCLHLEDVSWDTACRYHVHMPVQDGKRLVSASRIFSWAHTPIVIYGHVGLLTPHRVQTFVGTLDVEAGLLHRTCVVPVLAFVEIFATTAVVKQHVTGRTRAIVRPGLVHAHVLAEELREAALVHIIAGNSIISKFIARITAAQERAIGVDTVLYTWIFSGTFIHILAGPPISV